MRYTHFSKAARHLKDKDIEILQILRKNAREKVTNISKLTGVPASSIYDKVRMFERDFVRNHTTLIDFPRLGYLNKAHICLKVQEGQKYRLIEFLSMHPNVNSVYGLYNGFDVSLEAIFHDMGEVKVFIEEIEREFRVLEKQILHITEDIARERFFTNSAALVSTSGYE